MVALTLSVIQEIKTVNNSLLQPIALLYSFAPILQFPFQIHMVWAHESSLNKR
jgi:hypothetical protein